jgi:hypothetical protein
MMTIYRARGLVYLGAREYYERHVPGGAEAVAAAAAPNVGEFFRQIFLGSSMYDLLPILEISAAAAPLLGIPHAELVKRNAAWLAERDLRGVYRLLVHALPPAAVACRLPKLALKYFDFGEADANMQGERCCHAEQRGIPAEMAGWFQAVVQGFVPVALTAAGAKTPRVRVLEQTAQANVAHSETVALKFEFRWS